VIQYVRVLLVQKVGNSEAKVTVSDTALSRGIVVLSEPTKLG
jgi:hypothetical protein